MSSHGESVAEKAERRAFELLQAPEALTKEHILELYDLAPPQCKQGPTSARQMMTGGNPRSSNAPLHNIFDLPCVTQAVTKFVRHSAPGIPFSTVTILEGAKHGVHVDTHNAPPPNVIMNLTTFHGGGLWIEQTGGPDHLKYEGRNIQGRIWNLETKPVVFSASRLKHMATPWKGARRVVLIAFTVGTIRTLSEEVRSLLAAAGFCLPTKAQLSFYKAHLIRPGELRQLTLPSSMVRGSVGMDKTGQLAGLELECTEAIEVTSSDEEPVKAVGLRRGNLLRPPPMSYMRRLMWEEDADLEDTFTRQGRPLPSHGPPPAMPCPPPLELPPKRARAAPAGF